MVLMEEPRPRKGLTMNHVIQTEISDPQGGRNMIRTGDAIKVLSDEIDKTSFKAIFKKAVCEEDGAILWVDCYGGYGYNPALPMVKQPKQGQFRSVRPERVCRVSQAKVERIKETL